jgi:hypothetical protein
MKVHAVFVRATDDAAHMAFAFGASGKQHVDVLFAIVIRYCVSDA